MESLYWLMGMTTEAQNQVLGALEAWEQVCTYAPTETSMLRDSKSSYIVEWGDINPNLQSTYNVETGHITLNDNFVGCDSWYTGSSLLGAVYDAAETSFFPTFSFTRQDAIIAYDCYALAGAGIAAYGVITLNPIAAVGGTIICIGAGIGSMVETYRSFMENTSDGIDVTVSWITFLGGFIPVGGFGFALFQIIYDVN